MKSIVTFFAMVCAACAFASSSPLATEKWVRDYVATNQTDSSSQKQGALDMPPIEVVENIDGTNVALKLTFLTSDNVAYKVVESGVADIPVGLVFADTGNNVYQNLTNGVVDSVMASVVSNGVKLVNPSLVIVTNGVNVTTNWVGSVTNQNFATRLTFYYNNVKWSGADVFKDNRIQCASTVATSARVVFRKVYITEAEKTAVLTPPNTFSWLSLFVPSACAAWVAQDWVETPDGKVRHYIWDGEEFGFNELTVNFASGANLKIPVDFVIPEPIDGDDACQIARSDDAYRAWTIDEAKTLLKLAIDKSTATAREKVVAKKAVDANQFQDKISEVLSKYYSVMGTMCESVAKSEDVDYIIPSPGPSPVPPPPDPECNHANAVGNCVRGWTCMNCLCMLVNPTVGAVSMGIRDGHITQQAHGMKGESLVEVCGWECTKTYKGCACGAIHTGVPVHIYDPTNHQGKAGDFIAKKDNPDQGEELGGGCYCIMKGLHPHKDLIAPKGKWTSTIHFVSNACDYCHTTWNTKLGMHERDTSKLPEIIPSHPERGHYWDCATDFCDVIGYETPKDLLWEEHTFDETKWEWNGLPGSYECHTNVNYCLGGCGYCDEVGQQVAHNWNDASTYTWELSPSNYGDDAQVCKVCGYRNLVAHWWKADSSTHWCENGGKKHAQHPHIYAVSNQPPCIICNYNPEATNTESIVCQDGCGCIDNGSAMNPINTCYYGIDVGTQTCLCGPCQNGQGRNCLCHAITSYLKFSNTIEGGHYRECVGHLAGALSMSDPVHVVLANGFEECFKNCPNLSLVNCSTITNVGAYAFKNAFDGCTNLTSVNFSGLREIKDGALDGAFKDCRSVNGFTLYLSHVTNLVVGANGFGWTNCRISSLRLDNLEDWTGDLFGEIDRFDVDATHFDNAWRVLNPASGSIRALGYFYVPDVLSNAWSTAWNYAEIRGVAPADGKRWHTTRELIRESEEEPADVQDVTYRLAVIPHWNGSTWDVGTLTSQELVIDPPEGDASSTNLTWLGEITGGRDYRYTATLRKD